VVRRPHLRRDERRRGFDTSFGLQLWMQGFNESPRFLVRRRVKHRPLMMIERRRREHGRRNGQSVGREIFEEPERQRQRGDGACRSGAQAFVDIRGFSADRLEGFGDHRARAVRTGARDQVDQLAPADRRIVATGARDQVDQLAPADRRIVAVLGRLVEDGQQTIVKTHLPVVSFGRTLLLLYAAIYNALSAENITIP